MSKKFVFPFADENGRCHDCQVSAGEWHHDGCDVERCPNTFEQRISCECGNCGPKTLTLQAKVPFGFECEVVRHAVAYYEDNVHRKYNDFEEDEINATGKD